MAEKSVRCFETVEVPQSSAGKGRSGVIKFHPSLKHLFITTSGVVLVKSIHEPQNELMRSVPGPVSR